MSTKHEAYASLGSLDFEQRDSQVTVYQPQSQSALAWKDFTDGIKKWPIWLTLAYRDISVRYRRSILGPFWLTLSMAITIFAMGYLYGHLFHTDLEHYYPLLAAGLLTWTLLSSIITDATEAYITTTALIEQIKLPFTLYIHRVITRNFIIFFHNIVVMVPILLMFHQVAKVNWYDLLLIPGLIIVYVNAFLYSTIFAMIGARYRDVSQIIRSLVQVVFFVTPVMWEPTILPGKDMIFVDINPFYAFIQIIRQPLLGQPPSAKNLLAVLITTVIGILLMSKIFTRARSRIVYWL